VIRKTTLAVLLTAILLSAQKISIQPDSPKGGDEVTWKVSGLKKEVLNPVLLLVIHEPDTVFARVIKGLKAGEAWEFKSQIPEQASFLRYVVEDDKSVLLDDDGYFFASPIYDTSGKPVFDANRLYAYMFLENGWERSDKIEALLTEELALYPSNWRAYSVLSLVRLRKQEASDTQIIEEFDSLLAAKADSTELLYFAAMNFMMGFPDTLKIQKKAQQLMQVCAEKYPASKHWLDYQFDIYNFISRSPVIMGNYELNVFSLLKAQAKESGYFILMNYALEQGRPSKRVEELTLDFLKEFPESPLAPAFITNMALVKYPVPNSMWAKEMQGFLKKYPEDAEINLQLAEYFLDRNWPQALEYYRVAAKNSQTPNAAILFSEAASKKGKNFAEAKKYIKAEIEKANFDDYRAKFWWEDHRQRRRSYTESLIELYMSFGWLYYKDGAFDKSLKTLLKADSLLVKLPGYNQELYKRLLTVSEKAGNLSARKTALLNLIILEDDPTETQNKLRDIYTLENGSAKGFADWFNKERMKVALRTRMEAPVPDFPIYDIKGNMTPLSSYKGKVVVINFWATWCSPCKDEIPELNALVTEYKDNSNVVFIGLTKDPPQTVSDFTSENLFRYRISFEDGSVSKLFGIESIPTHLVIDKNGYLQYMHIGNLPNIKNILSSEIDAMLQE